MCTNMRWVKNPNCNHPVLVPCGHCDACQQEKAKNRTRRIISNYDSCYTPLFCTFTYDNDFVPYVRRGDLCNGKVPIYRNCSTRRVRISTDYQTAQKTNFNPQVIDYLDLSNCDFKNDFYKNIPALTGMPDCIGISYYRDIQNFYKRLRQKIIRNYGLSPDFSFYSCSEYGPSTFRCHFHSVIFCPQEQWKIYQRAVIESWPFDYNNPKLRKCEIARKPSKYVSGYVNKPAGFPKFFTVHETKPKHSYSQRFGTRIADFQLPEICRKIEERNLTYDLQVNINGHPDFINLPVPKYVISRYFPKFLGYSRLPLREICSVLECPERLRTFKKRINATADDLKKWITYLTHKRDEFISLTGMSVYDFSYYYTRAWKLRDMTILKDWYSNKDNIPFIQQYDNLDSFYHFKQHKKIRDSHPVFRNLSESDILNPNQFAFRVHRTEQLTRDFHSAFKKRKVNNICMSHYGVFV